MKHIKIIGIVLFSIYLIISVTDMVRGFNDACTPTVWANAYPIKNDHGFIHLMEGLNVVETDSRHTLADSVYNTALRRNVPLRVEQISTPIEISAATHYTALTLTGITALLALFGFYCLVRFYISLCRGDVLTLRNVRRLRTFMGFYVLFMLAHEGQRLVWMGLAKSQLALQGLRISESLTRFDWTDILLLIFLTEVFAVAVRLKEDQDLTV